MRASVYQTARVAAPSVIEAPDAFSVYQQETSLHEEALLAALRRRDEDAYVILLQRYYKPMLRCARSYVANQAVAEEVVQEAWLGVFQGVNRFEGKCTLRTWIFTILMHCAQRRGKREKRCVPFSSVSLFAGELEEDEVVVEEMAISSAASPYGSAQKILFCQEQFTEPEESLLAQELLANIKWAFDLLPLRLRRIIRLRLIEGWTSEEISLKYHITETHQRVLLHRARVRIRALLEHYLDGRQSA